MTKSREGLTILYIFDAVQALQPGPIEGGKRLANNGGHCVGVKI